MTTPELIDYIKDNAEVADRQARHLRELATELFALDYVTSRGIYQDITSLKVGFVGHNLVMSVDGGDSLGDKVLCEIKGALNFSENELLSYLRQNFRP